MSVVLFQGKKEQVNPFLMPYKNAMVGKQCSDT